MHVNIKQLLFTLTLSFLSLQTAALENQKSLIEKLIIPKFAYHRGNTDIAQENSRAAIEAALSSNNPYIEVDITTFKNNGKEIGLLVHENEMKRTTGISGLFQEIDSIDNLPLNITNPSLEPERIISIIELFKLIKKYQEDGVDPVISLDIKVEKNGEEFGKWLGTLIKKYNLEQRVFASSFWRSSLNGIKATCSGCMIGGVVFKKHFGLKFLSSKYSSLDIEDAPKIGFIFGFPGKKKTYHDFVLFHDEIFFMKPEIVEFWRNERGVKFVGIFTQEDSATYSDEQWGLIKDFKINWLELSPEHINEF